MNYCGGCGSPCAQDEHVSYSTYDGNMLCSRCSGIHQHDQQASRLILSLGARRWLTVTGPLNPESVIRYKMDNAVLKQVKIFVTHLLSAALGRRLQSWDLV
jgi:recombinational DNA repair protein (RecF pathway)